MISHIIFINISVLTLTKTSRTAFHCAKRKNICPKDDGKQKNTIAQPYNIITLTSRADILSQNSLLMQNYIYKLIWL